MTAFWKSQGFTISFCSVAIPQETSRKMKMTMSRQQWLLSTCPDNNTTSIFRPVKAFIASESYMNMYIEYIHLYK